MKNKNQIEASVNICKCFPKYHLWRCRQNKNQPCQNIIGSLEWLIRHMPNWYLSNMAKVSFCCLPSFWKRHACFSRFGCFSLHCHLVTQSTMSAANMNIHLMVTPGLTTPGPIRSFLQVPNDESLPYRSNDWHTVVHIKTFHECWPRPERDLGCSAIRPIGVSHKLTECSRFIWGFLEMGIPKTMSFDTKMTYIVYRLIWSLLHPHGSLINHHFQWMVRSFWWITTASSPRRGKIISKDPPHVALNHPCTIPFGYDSE